jgi:hypothetical protein
VSDRRDEEREPPTGAPAPPGPRPPEAEEALERIEDARSEAATYAVQRPEERERIAPVEERIVDVVEAASETRPGDTARLEDLAEEAETARDEIRDDV